MMTQALGRAPRRLPHLPTRSARTRTGAPGARRATWLVDGNALGQLSPRERRARAKCEPASEPSARLSIQLRQRARLRPGDALVLASVFEAFVRETK